MAKMPEGREREKFMKAERKCMLVTDVEGARGINMARKRKLCFGLLVISEFKSSSTECPDKDRRGQ